MSLHEGARCLPSCMLTHCAYLPPLQELITELQDQESFGKRGEVWAFGELAAVLLLLIPPFTLTVSATHAIPGPKCCNGLAGAGPKA